MADNFEFEPFIQSLIETVVWCRHLIKANPHEVTWPLTEDGNELWQLSDEQLKQHCHHIIADRSQKIKGFEIPNFDALLPTIRQGRLLIFYPGVTTSDGVAKIESDGYFNYVNYPPWDTWVYYRSEIKNRDRYLIAWVAPEFIDDVHWAIESCADESIRWLIEDKALPSPVKEALKAAHLWI